MKLTIALAVLLLLLPTAGLAINVGDPAPDFTLNDIGGTPHSLSDYAGKVVVLFFVGYG